MELFGPEAGLHPAEHAARAMLAAMEAQGCSWVRIAQAYADPDTTFRDVREAVRVLAFVGEGDVGQVAALMDMGVHFDGRDGLLVECLRLGEPGTRRGRTGLPAPGHPHARYETANSHGTTHDRMWGAFPLADEPGWSLAVCVFRAGASPPFSELDERLFGAFVSGLTPRVVRAMQLHSAVSTDELAELRERVRGLGARQRELLPLLMSGLSEQEIGDRIFRSRHTVHDHAKRVYAQLGVRSRVELVLKYSRVVLADSAMSEPR